jgi:hypothetical protein
VNFGIIGLVQPSSISKQQFTIKTENNRFNMEGVSNGNDLKFSSPVEEVKYWREQVCIFGKIPIVTP